MLGDSGVSLQLSHRRSEVRCCVKLDEKGQPFRRSDRPEVMYAFGRQNPNLLVDCLPLFRWRSR